MVARKYTKEQISECLRLIAIGYSQTKACKATGINNETWRTWKSTKPEFSEAVEDAYQQGTDVLADEVVRRGVEGWDEPVFYQGAEVGHVRKFSDQLLMFELKRRRPEYRDSVNLQHSGSAVDVGRLMRELDGDDKAAAVTGGTIAAASSVAKADDDDDLPSWH